MTEQKLTAKFHHYDEFNDAYVWALPEGRYVNLSGREVREHGAVPLLAHLGYSVTSDGRALPVTQDGRIVGTLPTDFEPTLIKSRSFLYDPRPGDFVRDGDAWVASRTLGPGDFEAIPGFIRALANTETPNA